MNSATNNTVIPTERFNCPTCEGAIDHANVLIQKLNGGRYEPSRQRITIHCEHCTSIAEVRRTRNGGVWQLDDIKPITVERERNSALARLEQQRARMQMEAA